MNIGVLASHEGTTLQSLIDACASGRIPGRVVVVVSNNSRAGALARARLAGIETAHLSSNTHDGAEPLDAAIRDTLVAARVDLVFLVLESGEAESGVSVHLVDGEYDHGPVVSQCRVEVHADDSVDTLKARIRSAEKELVVETVVQIAKGM
jgi:phosphoribosylglycinamide formyltransferase 1